MTTMTTTNQTALATFAASINQNGHLMAASGDDYFKALAWLATAPFGFFDFARNHPQAAKDLVNRLRAAHLPPAATQFLAAIPVPVWNEFLTKATADHELMANVQAAACGDKSAEEKSKETWIAIMRGIQYFASAGIALIDLATAGIEAILLTVAGILAGLTLVPAAVVALLMAGSVFVAALLATIVLGGIDLAAEIVVLALGGS